MNSGDYWLVVTEWDDDHGKKQRCVEHWANMSQFSVDELLKSTEVEKRNVLSGILTLDLSRGSIDEHYQNSGFEPP